MRLLRHIKKVRLIYLWKLIKLVICYPLFGLPTFRATKKCMALSTQHFGRLHYQNGPANAFRHALWNMLIPFYCNKWNRNKETILEWTKAITDWHEEAFFNRSLAQKMDLHNNRVGRQIYQDQSFVCVQDIVNLVLSLSTKSKLISETTPLNLFLNHLVHIKNEL